MYWINNPSGLHSFSDCAEAGCSSRKPEAVGVVDPLPTRETILVWNYLRSHPDTVFRLLFSAFVFAKVSKLPQSLLLL